MTIRSYRLIVRLYTVVGYHPIHHTNTFNCIVCNIEIASWTSFLLFLSSYLYLQTAVDFSKRCILFHTLLWECSVIKRRKLFCGANLSMSQRRFRNDVLASHTAILFNWISSLKLNINQILSSTTKQNPH